MSHCARVCGRQARWRVTATGPAGSVDATACDQHVEAERRSALRFGPATVEELPNAPPPDEADQYDLFDV